MRYKNLTFLFISVIGSANIYAVLLIKLSLSFSFSWLRYYSFRFSNWLLLPSYLMSITSVYLLILKIIHKRIYAVTQNTLLNCYGVSKTATVKKQLHTYKRNSLFGEKL